MTSQAWANWLQAVNARGDLTVTRRAVREDVRVERCGFASQRGQVVQVLQGAEAVNAWLAMTRDVCTFALGPIDDDAARYTITAGEFTGGGRWRATWAPDGRIETLRHEPDDLPVVPDDAAHPASAHPHDHA